MNDSEDLRIGLALGSGSSRGLSHIGIIDELLEQGVVPHVVCGSSVGAMVAASWVTGKLERLREWALGMTRFKAARFLDINARFTGFLDEDRFDNFLNEHVADDDMLIENAPRAYGAVATELSTARERWLTRGSLKEAVWASMALPGLFPPRRCQNRWLTDGGLVNPVPISLCHALGANFIVAVNLNGDLVNRYLDQGPTPAVAAPDDEPDEAPDAEQPEIPHAGLMGKLSNFTREYAGALLQSQSAEEAPRAPSLVNTIASAINITQDRITRSRMAGDPPDILLSPRLAHIGLLDLYKAEEAIEEGRRCVRRMLREFEHIRGSRAQSADTDPG